ncbi:hypothetical protein NUW58_g9426 [Xylaria curta]|uniref:Uncharacterized protein n=1 Tax=Xylaria curta TaxID=42375 RepID=A0ACC1MYQ5_9PEZI|nr:hypothetical protein NUW58_g9426 [Xylaria curta]
MVQNGELTPSPINGLPVELLREVLEFLPDVSSLYAAVLSCSLFHSAFLGADETITTKVLLNQIDPNVLPEALVAFESAQLHPHNADPKCREDILDFVAQNLQQRPTPYRSWSLRKAIQLGRIHSYVDTFAREFALIALSKCHLKQFNIPPTLQELCRIERALYRFEVYCNLFREIPGRRFSSIPSTIYGERKQLFFAKFAPHENEQLGCIHDFLVRAVSPSFNDVAEYDVHWCAENIDYDNQIDNPHVQSVLSLGLEKLYEISRAETYEERYRALGAENSPSYNPNFLYDGLQEDANERYNDTAALADITPENEKLYMKQPFFKDLNPGPKNAWRWGHIEESQSQWVYQQDREELRQWGYVMWDQSRLDMAGIFQGPWEDTLTERDLVLEEQESGREHAYMRIWRAEREHVSRAGASGWWNWGVKSELECEANNRLRYATSSSNMAKFSVFDLDDFTLQSGDTLQSAYIAYKTFGDATNPAIVYPTWYSGLISDNEWLIGEDKTLSPKKYFIIVPALFGNGQSTSPSNAPEPRPFPAITLFDNVAAQYRLVTEELGVKHVKAVLGWSMGAAQTFQWITQYPDFVDLAVPFCGAARCSLHNKVFLEGVKSALIAAKGATSGGISNGEATAASQYRAWTVEEREVGLKALGRVYAGWGFSQAFYREKLYETHLGFENIEEFMVKFWEAWALSKGKSARSSAY